MVLCAFLSSLPSLGAEEPRPERPNPIEQRLNDLQQKLKLSDEQVAKARAMFQEHAPELQKIRTDSSLSEEQKREKLREIFKQKIGNFLTPEQRAALATLPASGPEGERRPELPPFLKLEALKERLKLTEAQAGKIAPVLKEGMESLRELRNGSDASQRREKAREIFVRIRDRISSELNDEQKQQLKDWMAQARSRDATPPPPAK
jgi:hypothetical protein